MNRDGALARGREAGEQSVELREGGDRGEVGAGVGGLVFGCFFLGQQRVEFEALVELVERAGLDGLELQIVEAKLERDLGVDRR